MAGIGFRLQALVSKGSYLETATAYVFSAIISTGPWLSGVIALVILSNTTSAYLTANDRSFLLATIISIFAMSLLVTGGPQLLVTRYLADRLYSNERDSFAPTCTGVLFLMIPFSLLTAPFLLFAPFSIVYRLLTATLFLTLTMIWMVMAFLSAAREYFRLVLIFALCYGLGAGTSVVSGHLYGLVGSLAGFVLGQVICLALLLISVYREFPSTQSCSFAYLSSIPKYWDLLVVGALYPVGIWADSIIFWLSPEGQNIQGFYHLFPPYDTAKFVIYLSTIPAAAIFMIALETDFYRHYKNYYLLIQQKGTLSDLIQAKEGMIASVRSGIKLILKVQGMIALLLCLAARDLAAFVGIAPQWVPLLRIQTLAGTGQFLVFVLMLFLLYIDRRRATLLAVGTFTICNISLTLLSLYLGRAFYGLGYLGACIIGAGLGWILLMSRLKKLEYLTFMDQPLV
ncbi:MAG TPA: exopolysaccharide Pel transporter PelG [Ktedonobacteraceae bacterium]|nr:exopolysaccharide Pel transporter PelG [Ktedonobacteraceae bacterium]